METFEPPYHPPTPQEQQLTEAVGQMTFEDISLWITRLEEIGNGPERFQSRGLNAISDGVRQLIKNQPERAKTVVSQLANSENLYDREMVAENIDEFLFVDPNRSTEIWAGLFTDCSEMAQASAVNALHDERISPEVIEGLIFEMGRLISNLSLWVDSLKDKNAT